MSSDGTALVGARRDSASVTIIDFPADAFAHATQFIVDTTPVAVMGGPGGNMEFDLTWANPPVFLPSGGFASLVSLGGGRLMIFDSAGKPLRTFGRLGDGPGEFTRPDGPLVLGGDTLLVPDDALRRFNYFLPDRGLLKTVPMAHASGQATAALTTPVGRLGGDRLVWSSKYLIERDTMHPSRPPIPIGVSGMANEGLQVIDSIAGYEMIPMMTHFSGRARTSVLMLRFGQSVSVALWDSTIAIANGVDGYVLDQVNAAGHLVRRIRVAHTRRAVTKAMRDAQIALEMSRFHPNAGEGMVDPAESKRLIFDTPFADSLPPYGRIMAAPGNLLWVLDAAAPGDSAWDATAFRSDGAITGRLHMSGSGKPLAFGAGRVVVRSVDDDGVVAFKVYRFRSGR